MDEKKDLHSSEFCATAETPQIIEDALKAPEVPARFRWSGKPHRVLQLQIRVTLLMLDEAGKVIDTDETDTLVMNEAVIPEGFRGHLAALDIKL